MSIGIHTSDDGFQDTSDGSWRSSWKKKQSFEEYSRNLNTEWGNSRVVMPTSEEYWERYSEWLGRKLYDNNVPVKE